MSDDLISRKAVIAIIENKRLLFGKHDLSAEYKLAGVQEQIEKLPIANADKVIKCLEEEAEYSQYEANEVAEKGDYGLAAEFEGMAKAYKYAIEIVKSGGVADE